MALAAECLCWRCSESNSKAQYTKSDKNSDTQDLNDGVTYQWYRYKIGASRADLSASNAIAGARAHIR